VTVAATWRPSAHAGTSAVGLNRASTVRVSRDSARQALADATGTDSEEARSAQAVQADPGLAKLAASAEKAAAELAENAWQLPLAPGTYRLSARFGQCSGLWAHCHTGLDMAAPTGTPIMAVAHGVVSETGWAGAYGNRTVMTLEDGSEIWYCHQSSIGVRPGEAVAGGQAIGLVGSTGNSTGPHLHLEVRPGGGDAVDPEAALAAHGQAP
jgi:murein DD-endopeptidase MepM/ murein hydrolase activator NlpD